MVGELVTGADQSCVTSSDLRFTICPVNVSTVSYLPPWYELLNLEGPIQLGLCV